MKKHFFIFMSVLVLVLALFVFKLKNKSCIKLNFVFENYLSEEISLLHYDNDFNEVKTIAVDNIKQVFYTKNEDTRNYSYLIINDIKYDIGLVDLQDLENPYYMLTKTQLNKDNHPIYKYYIFEGADYLNSIYFQIINNKPVILAKIPFGFEFNNDKEIMTKSSFGTPFTSYIYKWQNDGIYVSDLNDFFKADYVRLDSKSKVISVIKQIDYQNPKNNKEIKFTLSGDLVCDY